MRILSVQGLVKRYGALVVCDHISFDMSEGEALGILGPNGAGKTTLFNLIAGTAAPNAGRMLFKDRDITRLPPSRRCRLGISRSFQIPHPFTGMTTFENVLVGATFGGDLAGKAAEHRAIAVLDTTGLSRKANMLAGSLTLIERKRLELARALATGPSLLLLDEIAGGLTEAECQELIVALRTVRAQGISIIWIEHVVHALIAVVDRIAVLDFGRKIAEGAPAAIMASAEVANIYLGLEAAEPVHG